MEAEKGRGTKLEMLMLVIDLRRQRPSFMKEKKNSTVLSKKDSPEGKESGKQREK